MTNGIWPELTVFSAENSAENSASESASEWVMNE